MSHSTYIVTNHNQLEPMFLWAQHHGLEMYKTRIGKANIAWVIEVPSGKLQTLFLIQYSNSVDPIANLYVY